MRYYLPRMLLLQVALDALLARERSFARDAREALVGLSAQPVVRGVEQLPEGGCVLAHNHYTRPGLGAWWAALALGAAVPRPVHYMMAGGWTYPDFFHRHTLEPLTAWAFRRAARVYRFTSMPPMPPRPHEAAARAAAVRNLFSYARACPNPLIALAPEGRDIPGGQLGWPPSGVGRMVLRLNDLGLAARSTSAGEPTNESIRSGAPISRRKTSSTS
jgi:hypothetical protein